MRIVSIAIFVLLVNACLPLAYDITNLWHPTPYPSSQWEGNFTQGVQNSSSIFDPNYYQSMGNIFIFSDFVNGFIMLLRMISGVIYALPWLMAVFYMPFDIAFVIQLGLYAVYFAGLVEMISGRRI